MAISDVCSLTPDALQERLAMIRNEILPHVNRTEELSNGLAWELAATPEMREKLEQLVELERSCCNGLEWSLEARAETLRLSVTGVDPRSGFFAALGGPTRVVEHRGGRFRLLKSGALGFGISFSLLCLLPLGLAALAGAAVAAPFAVLDDPLLVGASSIVVGGAAWALMRRRDRRAVPRPVSS